MENKKNIPNTVFSNYLSQIKSDTMENSKIKEHITNGIFDVHELMREGYLSQKKHDELYPPPPPMSNDEKRNIYLTQINNGELTDNEIKNLVDDGWFSGEYLMDRGVISKNKFEILFATARTINYDEWENIPPLLLNRVDVFVFGMAGSGKSCLLAGLLQYGNNEGKLTRVIHNMSGYAYADTLIEAVESGRVPTATSVDHIQNIACDIKDSRGDIHPLTFIEMSGEHFQDIYTRDMAYIKEKKPKLVEYLFESPNQKVIFLAIDFQPSAFNQRKYLEFMLGFLEANGTMKTVEVIVLVITKLDGQNNNIVEEANEFLKKQYKTILELCKDYAEKYGLDFLIYKFSLGNFKSKVVYEFNPADSQKLFDLLATITSKKTSKNKKGGGFWGKIFGK